MDLQEVGGGCGVWMELALQEVGGVVGTGWSWLRIGTGGGHL